MAVFIKLICDRDQCADSIEVEGHWSYDEVGPDEDTVYPVADGWQFSNGDPVLCPFHHEEVLRQRRADHEAHERAQYERLRAKYGDGQR